MASDLKRQNFNVTPAQEAAIEQARAALGAPTVKDTVLRAVHLVVTIVHELQNGGSLYVREPSGEMVRLLVPDLEPVPHSRWRYLIERPHEWRRQLYVKGRKLPAAIVCSDMEANGWTRDETAANWDLPLGAVDECIQYCAENADLLQTEADEELFRLRQAGVEISLENTPRRRLAG